MRRGRRGSTILEAALFIPILMLLIVGMVQIGKITFVYYTLKKTLYTVSRYIATQQNVNPCDAADASVQAAIGFALTGTTDSSAAPFLPALTADMIQVSLEKYSADSQQLADACAGSTTGPPDFVVVSIPSGYEVRPRIPFLLIDPILLRPQVKVPFSGTMAVAEAGA